MSEWMRTISYSNVGPCGPFPLMSFPESFLRSPPNICPKSVLKFARLDFPIARYTFTFCVTLLTLIVMQVSLWLFFLYESIHSFHNVSYGGKTVGFRDSKPLLFWRVSHRKTQVSLCDVLVHWWVKNLWNFYLPLSVQMHLLRQEICKSTESAVWKELRRCVGNQLDCKCIYTQMTLISSFS